MSQRPETDEKVKESIGLVIFCTLQTEILPVEISVFSEFNTSEEAMCKKPKGKLSVQAGQLSVNTQQVTMLLCQG